MNNRRAGLLMVGFIYILLLIGSSSTYSQYVVRGEVIGDGASVNDVTVELSNDNVTKPVNIRAGRFYSQLEWNKIYLFSFRKPGFVAKVIEFSTKVPDDFPKELLQPYLLQVRLFPIFEGVDTVFFEKPVAKIRFDEELRDFTDDRDYSLQVRYRVQQMRKKRKQKKSSAAPSNNQESTDKKVNSLINKGEVVKGDTITPIHPIDIKVINPNKKSVSLMNLHLPALKETYPNGKTVEEFDLEGRHVVRTIFFDGDFRRVLVKVEHNWGGVYYFIDELHIGNRCITREAYLAEIDKEVLYFKNKE